MTIQTITQMAADLKAGRTDPVELTEAVFDRIAIHDDPALFIDILKDRALAEAEASRLRWRADIPASPVDGLPTAWKDLFDLKGRVTTAGSIVLKSNPPAKADAPIVARAARAGMTSVGTVNMTEFAYSGIGLNPHYGTPRNIHAAPDAPRSPGGSSSGSGAVVAAGIMPMSMGSDTGGSVRIPASFNGVVGYKTSMGRYPMQGVFPLAQSLDTIGPLTHTVADCVLIDAVLRGRHSPDIEPADVSRLSFVIPDQVMFDGADADVVANFDATVARLETAGARVSRISLPQLQETLDLMAEHGFLAGAEALAIHRDRVDGPQAAQMDARVVHRILQASPMSAVDLVILQHARTRLMAETAALIGASVLLCPTTATTAMEIAPLEADQDVFFQHNGLTLRNTSLGNFLDWPGVSIPNGTDRNGMPTGLLLSTPHGRDCAVLAAALTTEDIIRG
ncbi:amidase [Rhodobacteraceae bacterium B1Z28]|uniref:Amidase n=1 Tax=Ruegeria haliotis TaxID=2747601 RepID=A0ABX2PY20_9RHOB|nr:amidase [Ruegeria haliotis]NVO58576.1 amidase [Ruegeria haliotis]